MLGSSGDQSFLQPANYGALRRGLFMRQLGPDASDEDTLGELFMCGVFSLLDRMMGQPLGEALSTLAVPERVRAALVDGVGPYQPLLELVRAIESESAPDIRAARDAAYIDPLDINRALLKTLSLAATLDRSRANKPEG